MLATPIHSNFTLTGMREQLLDLRTVWMRAWFSLSCAALIDILVLNNFESTGVHFESS